MIWLFIILVALVLMSMLGWAVVAITKATWLFSYQNQNHRTCRRCGRGQIRTRDMDGHWVWSATTLYRKPCECWNHLDDYRP